ncbi:MAG: DUF1700 domain-containing protein [Eubacterium sp.]
MTKNEFMRELTGLLSRIPEDEKRDALQYYEDYFADAGITDDMLVPNSVGTPNQVADKIIREAIYGESPEQTPDDLKEVPVQKNAGKGENYYNKNDNSNKSTYYNSNINSENHNSTYSASDYNGDNTKFILGIVIIIVTCPIWIGVVAGVGGILFGILAALGGIIIGFGMAGIALIVTAFLASGVAGGILLMGIGMFLLALAIVLVIPLVMYCGQFLPWLIREIINLVRSLLGKKRYVS